MDRTEINTTIVNYLDKYNPERIGIFGSFARKENKPGSDIDILVRFREPISLFDLVRIERELTSLLGMKVDLVTEPAIKNEKLKNYISKDLQIIFE